ncbi:hypothetical protein ARMGADRAFT_1032505 [Armillaria gallica]|uniref:Uncharacterized protein n=1 Tax=Armillaria gallica TaxID=47427 RepID=A0A2H3DI02_ARMGA|nr:hypothetical protein ARMGADRAFT_1032505 [Armillaria gallica]
MIARTYPGTDIPDLTDSQIKDILRNLDMQFNDAMIHAGGHASRNNFQSPARLRFLIFIILLLYLLATLNLYNGWVIEIAYTTLPNGKTFWTEFKYTFSTPIILVMGIDAILSMILTDATLAWNLIFVLIWRCWIVWGQSWHIVLILILCTTLAATNVNLVSRGIIIYYATFGPVQIVLVVLEARNKLAGRYIKDLGITIRGIVPTILVSRVVAGHARPDDSWSDSATESSIRFRSYSGLQNDSQMSAERGQDTSFPNIRLDLEEGLEDSTELRMEGAAPTLSVPHASSEHRIP